MSEQQAPEHQPLKTYYPSAQAVQGARISGMDAYRALVDEAERDDQPEVQRQLQPAAEEQQARHRRDRRDGRLGRGGGAHRLGGGRRTRRWGGPPGLADARAQRACIQV